MSKSAKKRAAKKARDEAAAVAEPPAPAPKAAAAPAKSAPAAKSKAAAKEQAVPAKAAGKAAAAPKEPTPPPAAKAEGKAKAAAKEAPKPKEGAGKAKAKAKSKAAEPAPEEPPQEKFDETKFIQFDDGSGGAWETATGMSKKQKKQKESPPEEIKVSASTAAQNARIPGNVPVTKADAKAAVPQSLILNLDKIKDDAAAKAAATSTVSVTVPDNKIGIVIGPKGSKIQMIQEKTGAKIDTSGNIFTISGPPAGVTQAETAVKDLIAKGFTSLTFDDFGEDGVKVHPRAFPNLIGKQGAVIRKIKEELKVEINIPPTPPDAMTKDKKYKVTVAGAKADVEKAKEVINDIVMYYHHEITHPGEVHEEMEVYPSQFNFIIGTKGSQLKHIQKNYNVKVNIPRPGELNSNVLIVGLKEDVTRAKACIDKILTNAASGGGGRREPTGEDFWDGEDDVEPELQKYIFKRH